MVLSTFDVNIKAQIHPVFYQWFTLVQLALYCSALFLGKIWTIAVATEHCLSARDFSLLVMSIPSTGNPSYLDNAPSLKMINILNWFLKHNNVFTGLQLSPQVHRTSLRYGGMGDIHHGYTSNESTGYVQHVRMQHGI